MPEAHRMEFKPRNPFPGYIMQKAKEEVEKFGHILESAGVRVFRPQIVDWAKVGGYTAAMPRDGLLTVGNTVVEARFSWGCRRHEIELAYSDTLRELASDPSVSIVRAPEIMGPDTIYD